MLKYTLIILCIVVSQTQIAFGQNLVNNPDFETYSSCPMGQQLLNNATGWSKPPVGITIGDYYNACNTSSYAFACDSVGVPNNFGGYTPAHSGNAYVGFLAYYGSVREYVEGSLSTPLVAGKDYEVSFFVRLPPHAKYAVDKIGLYLSNAVISQTFNNALTAYTPQVESSTMLSDINNWTLVTGKITAVGGEQYITIGNFHDNTTTNYITTGNAAGGCSLVNNAAYYYIDDVSVVPALTAYGDTVICTGDSTLIGALGGSSYSWTVSGNATVISTDSAFYVSPTQTTTYIVNGTDSVVVQVLAPPTVALGNDTGLCKGGSIVLDAGNSGATYLWSNGSTKETLTIKDTMFVSGGYFSVQVFQGSCTDEDTIMVAFYTQPKVSMSDSVFCQNTIVTLDATYAGATSYLWNTGDTSPTIDISTQNQYSVIISNNGCLGYDTVNTYMIPVAKIDLGEDTILCEGDSLLLDIGNMGTNYTWSEGSTGTSIEVTSAGQYSVIVQNSYCYSYDTINVTYQTYPVVGLGNDAHICIGNSKTLSTAYNGALYIWSTGEITQSIDVDETGDYWLIVDMNHCTDTDTVSVRVDPLPEFDLGEEQSICPDQEIDITVDAVAQAYYWNTGINNKTIAITEPGNYYVTIVDSNSCSYSDSLTINDECPTVLYVPSSFTPNGDGKNDVFNPNGNNVYTFYMEIYDRWGKMIFYSNDLAKGWDGNINGHPAIEDIYNWKINYKGERENNLSMQKQLMGIVVLFR